MPAFRDLHMIICVWRSTDCIISVIIIIIIIVVRIIVIITARPIIFIIVISSSCCYRKSNFQFGTLSDIHALCTAGQCTVRADIYSTFIVASDYAQ